MKTKQTVFFSLLLLASFCSFSQVSLTSYSIQALGATVSIDEKFSAELKLFANQWEIENTDIELAAFYQFNSGDYHNFSAGAGLGFNPFNGENAFISIPFALEIYPLQSFKRISLLFELAPEFYFENNINLRHLWGIRYTFTKKE